MRAVTTGALCNAAFFVILGLHEIGYISPHLKIHLIASKDLCFWFLIGLSCIYFLFGYFYTILKKSRLTVINTSISFSLIAMAIMLKFPRLSISFFWLVELCLLFAIGIYYREFIYRVLAWGLSILIGIRLFWVDFFSNRHYSAFGIEIHHVSVIFVFAALCFYALGALTKSKAIDECLRDEERSLLNVFVAFATVLVTCALGKEMNERWLSLAWAIEGVGVLGAGIFLRHKVYRIAALAVISFACLRVFFVDMEAVNTIYKIAACIVMGVILLAVSMIYAKFMSKEKQRRILLYEIISYFAKSACIFVFDVSDGNFVFWVGVSPGHRDYLKNLEVHRFVRTIRALYIFGVFHCRRLFLVWVFANYPDRFDEDVVRPAP